MHIFPFNTSWMQTADGNVARMPAQNVEVLESELTSVGHQFNISPGRIDFNRPVGVSVDLVRELKDEERQQIGLYRSDDGVNFTFVGKALNGNRLMGDINGACIVGAFLDSRPPVIDQLSFEAGQMLDSDRPMITARVRDGGSGISSETLFIRVDGREMSARYDGSKEMMIFEPSVSLAAGTHNLEIIARDRVGNETAMRAIAFQVPQSKPDILKAISWPNPASVMSTISFSLSGVTIGQTLDVNVKIYDGSGRLVTSIDPLAAGLNYRALWDLTNRRGGRVANGVYFYRIRVRMGDNLLQKTGKIAVLR
jgi:hypothetical protein